MTELHLGNVLSGMFPPSPKWSVDDIPDLTGKVAIVTDSFPFNSIIDAPCGNVGIGKETCKQLLLKGGTVWLSARSRSKAEEAINELKKETGKAALFLGLELSDLNAVKESAERFKSQASALHILICNAAVWGPPVEQLSAQGYDLQFGVNVLGHLLFINQLLPLLKSTSNSLTETRIIWVASSGNYFSKAPVNYDNLTDTETRKKMATLDLYSQSKFITVMLGYHLAKLLEEDQSSNVICMALDPGNIKSELYRNNWFILYPIPRGALTQLFAATAPEAVQYNGKYLRPWARLAEPHSQTKNVAEQQKMWDYCMVALQGYK
ncbi:NAD(P)-binding protein [Rhodocollybia butyracea]|uniref:NAD(P)-binding protein n=1 Tax=Rhodocollybia butyracea TaxID=206335 RepID=A0A9P5PA47_9AGAR|nr:NAD(P)-binding protein [Rhodocollybia butyracea]